MPSMSADVTNYRRFLLCHLTKSPSSRVTSRPDRFFSFFSSSRYDHQWRPLAYTWLIHPKYFKFSLLLTYTSAGKIHIQQFQFNCSIPPQRDYLTKFYISYIFLNMSNFWNFIFRNNAIDESDHFYLVQIPRRKVNCARRLCAVNVLHWRWNGSFFRLVLRRLRKRFSSAKNNPPMFYAVVSKVRRIDSARRVWSVKTVRDSLARMISRSNFTAWSADKARTNRCHRRTPERERERGFSLESYSASSFEWKHYQTTIMCEEVIANS